MEYDFHTILWAVRDWMAQVPFTPDILHDDADGLRVIWETAEHLAELIVRESEYAPYKWVAFTILDVRLEPGQEPVYSYHDREGSSLEEILAALGRGVAMMEERREYHV